MICIPTVEANRNDFDNTSQEVTFDAGFSLSEKTVTINFVNDTINEAEEGFIIVIWVVEIGETDRQSLNLEREGVALVRIVDNDRKLTALVVNCWADGSISLPFVILYDKRIDQSTK